jgi:hypothetical protein
MKRITFLLFIAIVAFVAVLIVKRPDIISNFWLWLVGLAGPIIAFFQRIIYEIDKRNPFNSNEKKENPGAGAKTTN